LISRLSPYADEFMGVISEDFNASVKKLIIYSKFFKYLRKIRNSINELIIEILTPRKLIIQERRVGGLV
jgi:hypothetical protein